MGAHAGIQFSHGICPTCWETVVRPQLERAGESLAPLAP